MFRWKEFVVAVAVLTSASPLVAQRPSDSNLGAANPMARPAVAGGDWSTGYTVDFGFATVRRPAASGPARAPGVAAPAPRPTTAPAPPRLHVLLLVDDTDKDAGPANRAGAAAFEKAIRAGIAPDRLATVETLAGPSLTADKIRGKITGLSLRPQDTLVAFYTGPIDFDDRVRWYTLAPRGGRIPRNDLRDWLFARGAALTVLLTDGPAYRITPEVLPQLPPPAGPGSLNSLFFANRGVVDVHAAALGENAFARDGEGGFFTLALVDWLSQTKDVATPADWTSFVDRVRSETDRLFGEYRRAVLTNDKVPAEDKRLYRDQVHQSPTPLTALSRVAPVPVAPPSPQSAEIIVHVPAGAKVFVEGRPTKSVGPERHFETAPLQPDREYTYSLRTVVARDGRPDEVQTRRVTVRAGEIAKVRFETAE
jgi:uncharacterized protein (TIGR03000 family)